MSISTKEKKEEKKEGKKDDKAEAKKEKAESKKEKAKDGEEKCTREKCGSCGKNVPASSVSKDEAKKSESKKTDTAEEKKDGSGDGAGTGWTSEQDAKIKEMKADNKSWKDIALEVGASKKDVQNRYRELTKSDGESGKEPEEKKNDGQEKSTWDSSGGGDTSGWTTIVDDDPLMGAENANMPDFGALFEDLDEGKGDGGGEKDEEKSAGAWSTGNGAGNDWSKSDTVGNGWEAKSNADKSTEGGKKQKGGKNNKGKQQNSNGSNSWESNNSGATTTGTSTSNSWPTTNASSWYNNSHRSNNSGSRFGAPFVDASPAQFFGSGSGSGCVGKLRPDGAWSEDDCEVLEWLMNRYKEDKWLHIQSGFYNWTKRMVSWEIIEQKFKDDGAL